MPATIAFATPAESAMPASIGAFRIIRLIGEGGMGAVYEAEQELPHRRVALKVIKAGLANREMLRRFEQEAQALGRLQHPGIAQIYEAGTASSSAGIQPYFAMEYIDGVNLLEWAKQSQPAERQRLELMAKICDAVHHAHQRGIIHRDLKPGNILVDGFGQPKILDFGVARVTDSDGSATRQTDVGQLIGTLAYMSPEQILADPLEIDTRSDVYSLGVILYQLLADRMPYRGDVRHLHTAIDAIRLEQPTRLGSLNRRLKGDVETIVEKALEKEKARRYASAAGLAGDIRRFLQDEPIIARPPSAVYQVHKFAKRHKVVFGAAAAVLVALVLGLVVSTREAIRANRAELVAVEQRDRAQVAQRMATAERDRASQAEISARAARDRAVTAEADALRQRDRALAEQNRANDEAATAHAINSFLQDDLLAQAGSEAQAAYNAKPDPEIKVRTLLDRAAGRMQGRFESRPKVNAALQATVGRTYRDIGLYKEAAKHLENSLVTTQKLTGIDSPECLSIKRDLGSAYASANELDKSKAILTEAWLAATTKLGANDDLTLGIESNLADTLHNQGEFKQAGDHYRRILAARRQGGEQSFKYSDAQDDLGLNLMAESKAAEAEPLFLSALRIRTQTLGEYHVRTLKTVANLGRLYWEQGRLEKAQPFFLHIYKADQQILGADHPETLTAMSNLGALHWKLGQYKETEQLWSEALLKSERVLGPDHLKTLILRGNLAELFRTTGQYEKAESIARQTIDGLTRVMGAGDARTVVAMKNLALILRDAKRLRESEELLARAAEIRLTKLERDHADTAIILSWLGQVRIDQANFAGARDALKQAVEIWSKILPDDYRRFNAESLLGECLYRLDQSLEGRALLAAGYKGLKQREQQIPAGAKFQLTDAEARLHKLQLQLQ